MKMEVGDIVRISEERMFYEEFSNRHYIDYFLNRYIIIESPTYAEYVASQGHTIESYGVINVNFKWDYEDVYTIQRISDDSIILNYHIKFLEYHPEEIRNNKINGLLK